MSAGHAKLAVARLGRPELLGKAGFALRSAAFEDGEELDPSFTADEEDAVAPPLEWTAPPPGTAELVLVVEDPDAGAEPACHWLVWGLAPQKGQLLEGEAPPRVGKNAHRNSEWLLPEPPHEDDPHAYVFQLFALDRKLDFDGPPSRGAVIKAMRGHVLAKGMLIGRYART